MRRTTVYLEPDLELLVKREMVRRGRSMADLIREALRAYLTSTKARVPPGAGRFASKTRDTAARTDAALTSLGFGSRR